MNFCVIVDAESPVFFHNYYSALDYFNFIISRNAFSTDIHLYVCCDSVSKEGNEV